MKTPNSDKPSRRFSPVRSPTHASILHSPAHPRRASHLACKENHKLFASQAVDGQGALASQVSDTQYFNQFGIDVSADALPSSPKSSTSRSFPSLLGAISQPVEPYEASPSTKSDSDSDWLSRDWMGENSWDYDSMTAAPEREPRSCSPLSEDSSPEIHPKLEPVELQLEPVELQLEPVELQLEAVQDHKSGPVNNFTKLSPFEQWVISRIRESHNGGVPLSTTLQKMKERCEFLDGMQEHYKRLLREIHFLSRELF
ncbi:hypothetical protein MSAN_00928800 [Mycena sanguinolenta]|uniref:Uncharacterized protein n=1 Tax=Mycena sanguinolenta TaxID=230812 RepID=A0A8H6YWV9_9AGAR|nr:hypothetical protein MSAN_00928800 [Mycena sanguinolenta]